MARMLDIKNSFKKDYKLVIKQGWSEIKINCVITQLLNNDILSPNLKPHNLKGDYKDFMECHIYGDLVIIYKRDNTKLELFRIGRHQDLFKDY